METITVLLGLAMIYSIIHFFILQKKSYNDRTDYEKVVSWFAIVSISLVLLGIMFE
jgi:hypothetical protein